MMFDLDGTLIDSVPGYLAVMKGMFDAVGLPQPEKSLVQEFMIHGMKAFERLIPDDVARPKDEVIQDCLNVGRQMSRDMFAKGVPVFEGVPELFNLLAGRAILVAVVTSTENSYLERKLTPLARLGLRDALAEVVGTNDAERRKPAPDPLLVCAERLHVAPETCIFVGDSRADIEAGNAAGMQTIGVLTGMDDEAALKCCQPTLILPGVGDILPLLQNEAPDRKTGPTQDQKQERVNI